MSFINLYGSETITRTMRIVLPNRRNSITQKFTIHALNGKSNYYITTDDHLQEIFISVEKTGSEHRALLDTVGRLISLGLQYGVPPETYVRLLGETKFQPGGPVTGHPTIRFTTSPLDLVARYLIWLQEQPIR